jgi:antitoxin PrlF
MAATLTSKLTAKAQTTLPSGVRKALGVEAGDELAYVIRGNQAVISKAPERDDEQDPTLKAFLDLLARDLATHPERLRGFAPSLIQRLRKATTGVEIDLNVPIDGPVAL